MSRYFVFFYLLFFSVSARVKTIEYYATKKNQLNMFGISLLFTKSHDLLLTNIQHFLHWEATKSYQYPWYTCPDFLRLSDHRQQRCRYFDKQKHEDFWKVILKKPRKFVIIKDIKFLFFSTKKKQLRTSSLVQSWFVRKTVLSCNLVLFDIGRG